jgi:Ca2+-binding RTX toxin-like protein
VIKGGSGLDTITGGTGNSTITGNGGNDLIDISAGGQNVLKYLALSSGTTNATWGNGADTVTGFNTNKDTVLDATDDKIDLSAIFSGQGITGITTANLTTYLSTSAATNSVIQIDRDGAGGAYGMTSLLTLNAVSLTNADLANMLTAGQLIL